MRLQRTDAAETNAAKRECKADAAEANAIAAAAADATIKKRYSGSMQ
jgi:hypothetical protein